MTAAIAPAITPATPTSHFAMIMSNPRENARARRNDAARTGWDLLLLGEGEVPVRDSLTAIQRRGYDGWIAVEWEKKWHPHIQEPEIAFPQHSALLRQWLGA